MNARRAPAGPDRIACRAELASLPALLALVATVCERERVDAKTAHALQLVAEEACVNVMHHAYPGGQPGPLVLQARTGQRDGRRHIALTLEDQGKPFDPLSLAPADTTASLDARAPGGLGVHLIRQLSDRQHYAHDPRRGNVFTVEVDLAPALP